MKACTKCHAVKALDDFYNNRSRPDGKEERCKSCKRDAQRIYSSTLEGLAARRAAGLRWVKKIKDAVYLAYGGYLCVCCGETEPKFLTIDHMNNDGAAHRKELGWGLALYTWLKRNHYPAGFQVLCMNCNWGRYNNGGICPHKAVTCGQRV